MITQRDKFYGVVLRHLTRHNGSFKVREVGDKAGHFCLNDDAFLLVKYSSSENSPWRFTFCPGDVHTLVEGQNHGGLFGGSYVCLVCGFESLCALREDEWSTLLELNTTKGQQTISVQRSPRSLFEVKETCGNLNRKIPASRFPSLVFE